MRLLMQSLILFLMVTYNQAAVFSTFSKRCTCEELQTKIDCEHIPRFDKGCIWNASTSKCSTPECKSFSQSDCDKRRGCSWNKQGACEDFTQCANYQGTNNEECYAKGQGKCTGGTAANGVVPCKQVTCSEITDQTLCVRLMEEDFKRCFWQNSKCVALNFYECTPILDQARCVFFGCKWSGGVCSAAKCPELPSNDCDIAEDGAKDTQSGVDVCVLQNGSCLDVDDAKVTLTAENCYQATSGWYGYIDGSCKQCKGVNPSQNTSGALFYALTLLALQMI